MRKLNRFITIVMALIMLTFVFAVNPVQVNAKDKTMTERLSQQVSFGGTSNAASQCAYFYYDMPIHMVKNYTPQTAAAAVYNKSTKGQTLYLLVFRFKAKKRAHVKISFNWNGDFYKDDVYCTPEEYKSPAKSVYIGNQLYFTGNTWAITYNATPKGKLKITPKKGWEVAKIRKININNFSGKVTEYKNGSNIKINKKERLMILFRNKKTNKTLFMMYDSYFNHTLS